MGSDGGPYAMDPITNYDGYFVPQGIGADLIATIEGFSREDVDKYALRLPAARGDGVGREAIRALDRTGARPERHRDARSRRAHAPRFHAREPRRHQGRLHHDGRGRWLRRRRAPEVPRGREDRSRPHGRQFIRHRRRRRPRPRRLGSGRRGRWGFHRARASSRARPPVRIPRSCSRARPPRRGSSSTT